MWPAQIPARGASDWENIAMLTVANLTIIGKMASRSCYLENGGFSKWCLKLVWVWPFLSNPGCFGVACYLRNAVHCQCMPHSDGYNYILNQWCGCKFKCLQILQDTATVMSKTFGFRGERTRLFLTEFCSESVVFLKHIFSPQWRETSILRMKMFAHWLYVVYIYYSNAHRLLRGS